MAMSIREATTPEAYLAALDEPRRSDIATIHQRVQAVAPSLEPGAERGFLTYGRYRYRYASGRKGEWFCLGVASNKQYISVYAPPTVDLERLVSKLPRANLGRGCIRFKRVADVDLGVLDEVIRAAADADGRELVWEKPPEA